MKPFLPAAFMLALIMATGVAIAEDSRPPAEGHDETTGVVRVQPRGQNFAPGSAGDADVQRKINDFNQTQPDQDKMLDKKLTICRRC
jgi:hypothetical protein